MGFLKLFAKSRPALQRLPAGSMTVDRGGNVVTTTVASTYPRGLLRDIAGEVLRLFREAHQAQIPLSELNLEFASLRITAREMRGGAIVFLSPKTTAFTTSASTERRL
jgi:hypothetical protein